MAKQREVLRRQLTLEMLAKWFEQHPDKKMSSNDFVNVFLKAIKEID
jgi:hypothetical protein